jgi:hypothetical protein
MNTDSLTALPDSRWRHSRKPVIVLPVRLSRVNSDVRPMIPLTAPPSLALERSAGSHSRSVPRTARSAHSGCASTGRGCSTSERRSVSSTGPVTLQGTRNGRFMQLRHLRTISCVAASHLHLKRPGPRRPAQLQSSTANVAGTQGRTSEQPVRRAMAVDERGLLAHARPPGRCECAWLLPRRRRGCERGSQSYRAGPGLGPTEAIAHRWNHPHTRGPCHPRAISSGHQRSVAVSHGHFGKAIALGARL